MTNKQKKGDQIISFAVMIQPLLIVIQSVLIAVLHLSADETTRYRVILTAVPMVVAMGVAFLRNSKRFILVYVLFVFLLGFTVVLFPDNTPYVQSQGLRFLLPVIVPSFICLSVVYDFYVVEKTLYFISWLVLALMIIYTVSFFQGIVYAEYNMPLSFACVLPFVSIYSQRRVFDRVAAVFLFVLVLAIGSRGAALCMSLYIVLDLFQKKSKWRILLLLLIIAVFFMLPLIASWLESIGIVSRTLTMYQQGEIYYDSGRASIRNHFWGQLMEHPILGIGLYGDRGWGDVPYCHNLFLEVFLDFGFLVGGAIVVVGLVKLVSLYRKSNDENRNRIIRYFCALVIPLMTSNSYLIDSGFAVFIGLCYLIANAKTTQQNVEDYKK